MYNIITYNYLSNMPQLRFYFIPYLNIIEQPTKAKNTQTPIKTEKITIKSFQNK